jgi:5'-3' exonuclease
MTQINDKLFMFDFQNMAYRIAMIIYSDIDRTHNFIKPYDFFSDTVLRKLWYDLFFKYTFHMLAGLNRRHIPVFTVDSQEIWRKVIYPEYKAHRAKARDDRREDIDYDQLFRLFEECVDLLKVTQGFITLKVVRAEADDIIGTLVLNNSLKEGHVLISNDSDFKQIADRVTLYPEFNDTTVPVSLTAEEAEKYLYKKILIGDKKTDNVPGVVFRVGKETVQDFFEGHDCKTAVQSLLAKYKEKNPDCFQRYKMNRALISFHHIPKLLQENIIAHYNTEKQKYNKDFTKIIDFCERNHLNKITNEIGTVKMRLLYG